MSNQVMYSLQKAEAAEALQWLEAPIPTIGEDDVLIKVRRTGICGTDIHIWDWDAWAQSIVPVPIITGHEFSGEVVEVGKNVSTLKVGQRVSGEGHLIQHTSRQARGNGCNRTKSDQRNRTGSFHCLKNLLPSPPPAAIVRASKSFQL